ncbi:MAG: hypothetical protein RSF42_17300 [Comamonas sp.]
MAYRPWLIKGPVYITIAASVRSPDIEALARAQGWNESGLIICTINSGVDVATLSIPSTIPNGVLMIINNGRIGGVFNSGTALTVRTNITVVNNGTIFGGGGKGGNGATKYIFRGTGYVANGYGGSGGDGGGFSPAGAVTLLPWAYGQLGTSQTVGGPSLGGSTSGTATGGRGGNGGAIGVAGATGSYGTTSVTFDTQNDSAVGVGKAAGNYIDGNAYVTWLATGTRLGNAI